MPRTALILAVAIGSLVTPSAAAALPLGGLTQPSGSAGCVGSGAPDGCASTNQLNAGPGASAVSPDGKFVYSLGLSGDIAIFARDTVTGGLTQVGCVNSAGSGGCTAASPLSLPQDLAISPDGKSVYVAEYNNDAILSFTRNASSGALTYTGCRSSAAGPPATCLASTLPLDFAISVTVSPDNASVYATALGSPYDIVRFNRDQASGAISPVSCISNALDLNCAQVTVPGSLVTPQDVAVSPDGKNVYAIAGGPNIAVFDRSPSGVIAQDPGAAGCLGAPVGCAPSHDLNGVHALAISPDGKQVYATGAATNSVAIAQRAADGNLTQAAGAAGCVSSTAGACASATNLGHAYSITVSGDGGNVYVGGAENPDTAFDSLAAFSRGGDGSLTQLASPYGCYTNIASPSCSTTRLTDDITDVTVSPEGNNVYTSAWRGSTVHSSGVGIYIREVPPICADSAPQTLANIEVTDVPLSCSDPNGDPTTLAISTPPTHGTASINQGTRRARFSPTSRYHGADSFKFTASDGSLTSNPATAQISLTDKIGPVVEFGNQKSLRLSKTGSTKVTLKCPKTEVDGCPNGKLTIGSSRRINITLKRKRKAKLSLGRANYTLAAGQTKGVRVKLNKTARRVVRQLRNVRVNLTATTVDPAGNAGKTTKSTHIKTR
jgi:DNA-binding beta-propeller fold protein YncE